MVSLVRSIARTKQLADSHNELKHLFVCPFKGPETHLGPLDGSVSGQERTNSDVLALDLLISQSYGLSDQSVSSEIMGELAAAPTAGDADVPLPSPTEDEEEDREAEETSARQQYTDLISYCVGSVVGRWDIRFATDGKQKPELPDPFGPLPVCSPGMLKGDDGLPPTVSPAGYAVRIDSSSIFPDDPDHSDDIVRRVREALELIWKDRADAIEKEACEILGVENLRQYVRKPGKSGFWDDHVARYSKSRRKAPIYWLLQSSKKNYALWLYYHRLDKETLHKALLSKGPVLTKTNLEESRLDDLRKKSAEGDTKTAKKLDKEIDKQEELLNELKDFAEKLERAAKLEFGDKDKLNSKVQYNPDLNDGVVLNIAPLHELVPWKPAADYWQELLNGEYEWSSMSKLLREKGLVK